MVGKGNERGTIKTMFGIKVGDVFINFKHNQISYQGDIVQRVNNKRINGVLESVGIYGIGYGDDVFKIMYVDLVSWKIRDKEAVLFMGSTEVDINVLAAQIGMLDLGIEDVDVAQKYDNYNIIIKCIKILYVFIIVVKHCIQVVS